MSNPEHGHGYDVSRRMVQGRPKRTRKPKEKTPIAAGIDALIDGGNGGYPAYTDSERLDSLSRLEKQALQERHPYTNSYQWRPPDGTDPEPLEIDYPALRGMPSKPLKQTLSGRRPTPVDPMPGSYSLLNAETHALLAQAAAVGGVKAGEQIEMVSVGLPDEDGPPSHRAAKTMAEDVIRRTGNTALARDVGKMLLDSDTPHSSQRRTTPWEWEQAFGPPADASVAIPSLSSAPDGKVIAHSDKLTDYQVDKFEDFLTVPGNEFAFRIGRTIDAFYRDGLQAGFSGEAMDAMAEHVNLFIGSRVIRFYNANQVMAQRMTVRIRVSLDSEPEYFEDDDETQVINIPSPPDSR